MAAETGDKSARVTFGTMETNAT